MLPIEFFNPFQVVFWGLTTVELILILSYGMPHLVHRKYLLIISSNVLWELGGFKLNTLPFPVSSVVLAKHLAFTFFLHELDISPHALQTAWGHILRFPEVLLKSFSRLGGQTSLSFKFISYQ
jgi:hypothetical protein